MSQTAPYRTPDAPHAPPIVVTTCSDVPGFRITQIVGIVQGFEFREQYALANAGNAQAQLQGRRRAVAALVGEATALQAHAVIGLRYESTERDFLAYGTAVRIEAI